MLIYLEKEHHKKTPKKTIKHLLKLSKFPKTYKDKKYEIQQCKEDKSRSICEFYYIIKTIFPYVSQKYVFNTLFTLLLTNKYNKQIICCNNIDKIVIYHNRFVQSYSPAYGATKLFFGNAIYDHGGYIKSKRELVDKFNIVYFLKKVGFSIKDINNIIYNKSNKKRKLK